MRASISDFWILAGILSSLGGLGIYEGYEVHSVFYSQSSVLFGAAGLAGYKVFYSDKKATIQPVEKKEMR